MATSVLICDDSGMARKQMFRSLPPGWDVDVTYAENGSEGINAIQQGLGEITFLDLTMPIMDGYQVLEQIRKLDLQAMVVVVSGDVQPEAYERVMQLGALDFIQKPVNAEKLADILHKYGVLEDVRSEAEEAILRETQSDSDADIQAGSAAIPVRCENKSPDIDNFDCYREITNIAMGQAASLLARLLDVFVQLPIPNINFIEVSEFAMAMQAIKSDRTVSAVCQGFIGSGIAGEAIVMFEESSFQDMARLMKYQGELGRSEELEVLLDTANILIGATLRGIAEPMNLTFSQGHPLVLGQHCRLDELIKRNITKWKRMLAIEVNYRIENYNINCDLLLLFSEEDMPKINDRIAYLR